MNFVANNFLLSATDLSNHLACRHLTQLNRLVALDELKKPKWYDPSLQILIERGQEHEAAYVEYLRAKGLVIVNLKGKSTEAALNAMQEGIDVLVQAQLDHDNWMGFADILLKVPGTSKFGNWSYEVQDTKLSQNTRAATILQLCMYSELLSIAQGSAPEKMYVVKPGDDFPTDVYRYVDFQSYYRTVKDNFEQVISGPAMPTYPEPVEHCSICRWWQVCDKKRHADDYLSLVAGIRSLQIAELQKQKLTTLKEFAEAKEIKKPKRGNYDTFIRKQAQAKVQLNGRTQNELLHEILPVENERGFNRLPEPSDGDIYLDLEGDNFFPDGGLEYLIGYAYRENGDLVYRKTWASNRSEEKKAFQSLMEFVIDRWHKFPKLHLYHFAPYEPTAIKRMSRVHALFEKDLDELLREKRFVDLHATFKEALLASVEVYSLKELEKFTPYTRKVTLHDASVARKTTEIALEMNEFKSIPEATLKIVESYNEDDSLATEGLHVWLENRRSSLTKEGYIFQRPTPEPPEVSDELKSQEKRSQDIFNGLTSNLPDERTTDEEKAKWLLAHQMDYFRREDKSAWWEYFRVHSLEHEDLLDERKAITGLEFIETLPLKAKEKLPTHRYSYPTQEIGLGEGDNLVEINGDKIGTVVEVHLENNTIDIKKTSKTIDAHPAAIHVNDRINPGSLWTSIMDFGQAVCEDGLDHKISYRASKDLLMRRKPKLQSGQEGAYVLPTEDALAAAVRIALSLDYSILPIQGPPGTGKTHTGAKMIIELVKAKKKVGVTAISHRVITTLFQKVKELSDKENVAIHFVHKVNENLDYMPEWINQIKKTDKILEAIDAGSVAGGTAWLWSSKSMYNSVDYLFIDEAGQMSLSQSLAASAAARNLILLGDPQQLEQPQKGAHPEGSDIAALTYLLEEKPTMPEGKGLFLGMTHRIHPAISRFTSDIFYEGKLNSSPGLENQRIDGGTPFDGAGLYYVPVNHVSNQNWSPEEIDAIAVIAEKLLAKGEWVNEKKEKRKLVIGDILIVAPYNAQVSALIERLPAMRIGTVDKFQGQEAPVVIYSMTSSSHEDAPRGMGFLYNPNRLNVATSRAKGVCILVASPRLMEPECRTIEQMKWANALCHFREMAKVITL
jgi:predicted RecB family nuclease